MNVINIINVKIIEYILYHTLLLRATTLYNEQKGLFQWFHSQTFVINQCFKTPNCYVIIKTSGYMRVITVLSVFYIHIHMMMIMVTHN